MKKLLTFFALAVVALFSLPAFSAGTSGTAKLTWGAVTLDDTGAPLPAGTLTYTIYQGFSSTTLTPIKTGVTGLGFTFTGLTDGIVYYYAVSATFNGTEGAKSPVVSKKMPVPVVKPNPPTGVTVQ